MTYKRRKEGNVHCGGGKRGCYSGLESSNTVATGDQHLRGAISCSANLSQTIIRVTGSTLNNGSVSCSKYGGARKNDRYLHDEFSKENTKQRIETAQEGAHWCLGTEEHVCTYSHLLIDLAAKRY